MMSQTKLIISPGEVLQILGNELTFRVTAEQTDGEYSLVDYKVGASFPGPAPHVHQTFEEIFFVLEGAPTFLLEGEQITGAPGMVVSIPRGKVHTFGNPGPAPARFLVLSTPAGFELYFKELHQLITSQQGPLDMAVLGPAMAQLGAKYDSLSV